jgi:hypothetical protein
MFLRFFVFFRDARAAQTAANWLGGLIEADELALGFALVLRCLAFGLAFPLCFALAFDFRCFSGSILGCSCRGRRRHHLASALFRGRQRLRLVAHAARRSFDRWSALANAGRRGGFLVLVGRVAGIIFAFVAHS